MKTFLLIMGPKIDLSLVKTVGLILAVIGAVVFDAQRTATINPPVILLAIGNGAALAFVEFIYVIQRVISPIYLVDAFAEIILIAWWVIDLVMASLSSSGSTRMAGGAASIHIRAGFFFR